MKNLQLKYALENGLIFGLIMILISVILYVSNIDPVETPIIGTLIGLLNYLLLPITILYLACNNYKKLNDGYISIAECIKIGIAICLLAGLLYGLYNIIFNFIFPDFLKESLDNVRRNLLKKSPDMSTEQIEKAISMTRKLTNPIILIITKIIVFSFIGLIYSSIIGAIIKRDKLSHV
jgi:hypothetical protein